MRQRSGISLRAPALGANLSQLRRAVVPPPRKSEPQSVAKGDEKGPRKDRLQRDGEEGHVAKTLCTSPVAVRMGERDPRRGERQDAYQRPRPDHISEGKLRQDEERNEQHRPIRNACEVGV